MTDNKHLFLSAAVAMAAVLAPLAIVQAGDMGVRGGNSMSVFDELKADEGESAVKTQVDQEGDVAKASSDKNQGNDSATSPFGNTLRSAEPQNQR
ncbi:MAG: hypothetical protein AAF530_06680 [Pseudomonadota bacterium]